jgi:predicted metal-dependent peptidase
MKEVSRSQNVLKKTKTTFSKANRRDPLDFNRPGKITSNHYLPDLHIYIDTSGSISEANYQQAVLMLIKLAKKLNVDLYFNSFSHVMSQEVLLRTKDKSVLRIWEEFRTLPKVTGGTDYKQIWNYINISEKRKRRLSLVVTDFEWSPSTQREQHPANLYYAPCSSMNWASIVQSAGYFSKSMRHIEPAIAQRLIGLVA